MKPKNNDESNTKTMWLAIIPVLFMGFSLNLGVGVYGTDPHIPLLLSSVVAVLIAFKFGYS